MPKITTSDSYMESETEVEFASLAEAREAFDLERGRVFEAYVLANPRLERVEGTHDTFRVSWMGGYHDPETGSWDSNGFFEAEIRLER